MLSKYVPSRPDTGAGGNNRPAGTISLAWLGLDQSSLATAPLPLSYYSILMSYLAPAVTAIGVLGRSVGGWSIQLSMMSWLLTQSRKPSTVIPYTTHFRS